METGFVQLQDSFQALSEIALTINSIQEPDALLEKVLEITMYSLNAERAFILLNSSSALEGFEVKNRRNFTEQ